MLDRLVEQAVAANYDLRIVEQHPVATRADCKVAIAATPPHVSFGGSAEEMRSSTILDWPPDIDELR